MKYLILFSIVFALSFVAYNQEAFALLGCDIPHCYSLVQSSRSSEIDGIQYELDSPDLFVDQTACDNIAVSTGWLTTPTGEWVESGVTKGFVENVGCVTALSTYYAFNNIVDGFPVYQEFLVPSGRVDPGDDIQITLQKNTSNDSQIQIFVTTPDITSVQVAQLTLETNNQYYADFGIEGTISAPVDYSSIPMSKFTNLQIKQSNVWVDLPSSASLRNIDTSEGYIGQKCSNTSFIAGSVLALDCNNIAVSNQAPNVSTLIYNPVSNAPITISLDAVDTDFDYLIYNLIEIPTNGFLDYNNLGQPIPNTDGDSSQLVYTPASSTPENDIIRYSVTDTRIGHTEEGLITIIGPTPSPTIPDPVDDFDFSLAGTTITFTWNHPYDGGSPLESYRIERSIDTVTWAFQDTISETLTSYVLERYEGYDQYFRIFANNAFGDSSSSNVVNVHIDDTTPPSVQIFNPTANEIIPTSSVSVDGNIFETQSSGIRDIEIQVDGVTSNDPIFTDIIYLDTNVNFDSILTSLTNGVHTITAFASNDDGYTGNDSVSITIDIPVSTTLDSFLEDFEVDMSNWILTTQDDEFWSVRANPLVVVPDSVAGNQVGGTEDCDNVCTMSMIDHVDLTPMAEPTLSFYRYVATGADIPGEGIIAYYSVDDGFTWNILDSFLADDSKDDGIWHLEEYDLSIYNTTEFKVKFDAISTANSEDTELDNILIIDNSNDEHPQPEQDLTVCATVYAPVCSVDGKTFSNMCMLDAADIELDYEGVCMAAGPEAELETNNVELFCGEPESYYDNVIIGTEFSEILIGTSQNDLILGLGGNDFIKGNAGNDCIYGADGNDVIIGSSGDDIIHGDSGNDTLFGNGDNDTMYGGEGHDTMRGHAGNDTMYGGIGDDTVYGNQGTDTIYGESGNDALFGNSGIDTIFGGDGNDTIWGLGGIDTIDGGNDEDICIDITSDNTLSCEITS